MNAHTPKAGYHRDSHLSGCIAGSRADLAFEKRGLGKPRNRQREDTGAPWMLSTWCNDGFQFCVCSRLCSLVSRAKPGRVAPTISRQESFCCAERGAGASYQVTFTSPVTRTLASGGMCESAGEGGKGRRRAAVSVECVCGGTHPSLHVLLQKTLIQKQLLGLLCGAHLSESAGIHRDETISLYCNSAAGEVDAHLYQKTPEP